MGTRSMVMDADVLRSSQFPHVARWAYDAEVWHRYLFRYRRDTLHTLSTTRRELIDTFMAYLARPLHKFPVSQYQRASLRLQRERELDKWTSREQEEAQARRHWRSHADRSLYTRSITSFQGALTEYMRAGIETAGDLALTVSTAIVALRQQGQVPPIRGPGGATGKDGLSPSGALRCLAAFIVPGIANEMWAYVGPADIVAMSLASVDCTAIFHLSLLISSLQCIITLRRLYFLFSGQLVDANQAVTHQELTEPILGIGSRKPDTRRRAFTGAVLSGSCWDRLQR